MKCTILGRHIRLLGKAIHALAKVGEELYIEPLADGINFVTVNSSKSAVMTFKFFKDFFESYEEKCVDDLAKIPASDPVSISEFCPYKSYKSYSINRWPAHKILPSAD